MSRYFTHVNVMKVTLEILLLVFRTSRMLIILKLDWDSIFFSVCVTIISQFEKFSPCYIDTPVWSFNTNTYIYTCRGGIYINILSYKPSFWHFGEWVSFEKTSFEVLLWQNVKTYIITESWQCLNCFVHSLNLAKKIDTTLKLSQKDTVSQTE